MGAKRTLWTLQSAAAPPTVVLTYLHGQANVHDHFLGPKQHRAEFVNTMRTVDLFITSTALDTR